MPTPEVQRAQAWLDAHEQELIAATQEMLRIPSIESEPEPGAPFGIENRRALDLALDQANAWGMKTRGLEGYCGWAEIGDGPNMVMTLGHLDVVPVGPGWKHDPFGAEIDEGYLYARGATDDKGPTMASFFAVRAIQETCPDLGARVRIVFGCNEESGFKCVERYMESEEVPTFGIAPDSGWPCYHGEKGIMNLYVSAPLPEGPLALVSCEGGQRPNIVIDQATATVRVTPEIRSEIDEKLAESWDRNVTWTWNEDLLQITAVGKAAHGAMPMFGDSAATRLFRFLYEIAPTAMQDIYGELMNATHIGGVGLGVDGADEPSGGLTSNLGVIETSGDRLKLLFNLRYPVTWSGDDLAARARKYFDTLSAGLRVDEATDSAPLYFPLEHPLIQTVCDVVREEADIDKAPGVMGGGTYARAIPNTVSVGTSWPGDGKAHETDERIKVDHLLKAAKIYAHILIRLAQQAAQGSR
ncbi:MAG: Sapep family Mn(2+)-dependent dipeptidase [Fimbriimonadaceae bacterium]